jgi:hypothetical protein|tara:strand:- start:5492 stop:5812 length:321 start_codon:yes stop_codon:yes gene_type:complete
MNYLKDAGTIVEASMMQAYQKLSNNDTDYTVQVIAMYPTPLNIAGEIERRYLVVIEVGSVYDYRVAVCYNGILMYIVENPNNQYYEDLKNNNLILDARIASEVYND